MLEGVSRILYWSYNSLILDKIVENKTRSLLFILLW